MATSKRRPRGQRGSVIKDPKRGTYSIRWSSGDRKHRKGPFHTKALAQAELGKIISEINAGLYIGDLSFAEMADRFFATYDRSNASRKKLDYFVRMLKAEFGPLHLSSITPEHVARWRITVSPGSQYTAHGILRQILTAAVKWGYLTTNPALAIKNPMPKAKEVAIFSGWDEVLAVAREMDPVGEALVIFAAGTGLRPEEWCSVEWGDIVGDSLIVSRSWTEDDGMKQYGKTTGSRRRVPLRKIVIDALNALERTEPRIFSSPRGGIIRIHNWRSREWMEALSAANVPYRKPYSLRHTYAAWSLAAGINTFQLARRMGTSVEMIDRTYGHLIEGSEDSERELLDNFDDVPAKEETD